MQSAVTAAKEQVERDKEEIEDTIQNSLLASAEQILDSVKSYFERAEALYQSMYFECDGGLWKKTHRKDLSYKGNFQRGLHIPIQWDFQSK